MRFRPGQHLRRQSDIRAVREQGRRVDGRAFTVWWKIRAPEAPSPPVSESPSLLLSPEPHSAAGNGTERFLPRAAVIASIAAVGPAVRRNRAKRRLRELFRKHQDLIPAQCDVLLIARAAAVQWDFTGLERTFVEACRRIPPLETEPRSAATHD